MKRILLSASLVALILTGQVSAQSFEVISVSIPVDDEQNDYRTTKVVNWLSEDTSLLHGLPEATPGTLTGAAKMFQALAPYIKKPPPALQLAQE